MSSSLKQTIKGYCPDSVLAAYGSVAQSLRKSPELASTASTFVNGIVPAIQDRMLRQKLFGPDAVMVPPMHMIHDGSKSLPHYKSVGLDYVGYFTDLANLKPHSAILDLGCGIGRCAVPLTKYFNNKGKYVGLDVDAQAIGWCQKAITPRYSNFSFQFLDVYSSNYNPHGTMLASELKLPCDTGAFDLAVAISLFTHMYLDDVQNYLIEMHRALKPGGSLLMTAFLLNQDSMAHMNAGKGLQLRHPRGRSFVLHEDAPETAVGHPEEALFEFCRSIGFENIQTRYGHWCGRDKYFRKQDVIVCQKK